MKSRRLAAAVSLFLLPFARTEAPPARVWNVEGLFEVRLPEEFQYGIPFPLEVRIPDAPPGPRQLEVRVHHLAEKGRFAGALPDVTILPQPSDKPGLHRYSLQIDKAAPGMTVALVTLYLTPDGSWAQRIGNGSFPVRPPDGDHGIYTRAVERAQQESGLREKQFPPYSPREDYFDQPVDRVGIRSWKPERNPLPPLEAILAAPPADLPPYGLYAWGTEFARGWEEVKKVGIRSMRLAGPRHEAEEALHIAGREGFEVLMTLRGGADRAAYRGNHRAGFDSDEAFIANFVADARAFLARFGPEGSAFADRPYASPVRVLEIWNEPNFFYLIPDSGDRPADERARAALYAQLLSAAVKAVREAAPGLKIAGFAAGGAANADVRFIRQVLTAHPELAGQLDLLSTHPYTMGAPPEARKEKSWGGYAMAESLAEIRRILAQAGAENLPVWYTELGWQISSEHGGPFTDQKHALDSMVTPDFHAAYTVRAYLWALRLGVPRVHIMHMHDSDHYNCGFFDRQTLAWRPVAHAVHSLISLLPNPRLLRAIHDGPDELFVYEYLRDHRQPDAGTVLAAWAVAGPTPLTLRLPPGPVRVIDLMGKQRQLTAGEEGLTLTVGPFPLFILPE